MKPRIVCILIALWVCVTARAETKYGAWDNDPVVVASKRKFVSVCVVLDPQTFVVRDSDKQLWEMSVRDSRQYPNLVVDQKIVVEATVCDGGDGKPRGVYWVSYAIIDPKGHASPIPLKDFEPWTPIRT
jgi:hypothetical protein